MPSDSWNDLDEHLAELFGSQGIELGLNAPYRIFKSTGNKPGRKPGTHCPRGHPWPEKPYVPKDGRRRCRVCNRQSKRRKAPLPPAKLCTHPGCTEERRRKTGARKCLKHHDAKNSARLLALYHKRKQR